MEAKTDRERREAMMTVTEQKVLDALRISPVALNAHEVARRAKLASTEQARRALRFLVKHGFVARVVRRRFVGVQNAAFPRGGASRVLREAMFSAVAR